MSSAFSHAGADAPNDSYNLLHEEQRLAAVQQVSAERPAESRQVNGGVRYCDQSQQTERGQRVEAGVLHAAPAQVPEERHNAGNAELQARGSGERQEDAGQPGLLPPRHRQHKEEQGDGVALRVIDGGGQQPGVQVPDGRGDQCHKQA